MAMPLEVELLITAWDNAKKNCFGGDGLNIDPETGEIVDGTEMPPDLADLVADIDDKMIDLVSAYSVMARPERYLDDAGDYEDENFVDIRETAENL